MSDSKVRSVLAVVVGYLAVAAWTALVSSLAWKLLGADFAFQEGTLFVSTGWIILLYVVILTGSVLGGFVTVILGGKPRILGIVVAVLWLLSALIHAMVDDPRAAANPAALSAREAAAEALFPLWYNFTIPFVGFMGVQWGSKLRSRASRGG